jgi:hypothetical protein
MPELPDVCGISIIVVEDGQFVVKAWNRLPAELTIDVAKQIEDAIGPAATVMITEELTEHIHAGPPLRYKGV